MPSDIRVILKEHAFPDFSQVEGRCSIADLHQPQNRCGIYLLQFRNGEYYIGQAVDVVRRFGQHRKNHDDIIALSFLPTAKDKLTQIERSAIDATDLAGIALRNIVGLSEPMIDSDFDDVVSKEEQSVWLSTPEGAKLNGERVRDDNLRRKYTKNYERFQKLPFADDVVAVMRRFVATCIPFPMQTELSFWACSCHSRQIRPRFVHYSTINVNWQEILTICDDGGILVTSIHLAKSVIEESFGGSIEGVWDNYPTIRLDDHRYVPGGPDQFQILMDDAPTALKFLSDTDVGLAIRTLVLRLMRKGPTTHGRYHCFDLADLLLAQDVNDSAKAPALGAVDPFFTGNSNAF